ncbi:class I adenylate-forming enzyme family protein [Oceanobacillus sp. CAU 1775]
MELQMKNKPIHEYLEENALEHPNKVAINFYGTEITYHELNTYINRTASFLVANGIQKGDAVALFMQNSPQFIIGYFAAQKIGAIPAPCNPMFKEWELQYQLNDLKTKVIFIANNLMPILSSVIEETSIQKAVIVDYETFLDENAIKNFSEPKGKDYKEDHIISHLEDIIKSDLLGNIESPEIDMVNDTALIIYTSGTTGSPKGAMLTYKNSEFKTNCLIQTYSFDKNDIFLSVMPIFHIAGMVQGMLSPLAVGSTIILLSRFDPKKLLQCIAKYKVSVLYTTPPMNVEMLKIENISDFDLSSLRLNMTTSFGIQINKDISDQWEKYANVPLFEWAYGMSEAHTGNSLMRPNEIKYGTHGKPTYMTEIKIVDPNDYTKEVASGEEGEIILKSPSVFKGYLNRPEATEESLKNGWFLTGDIGKFDEDGYLIFLGRVKEMIKCSGYSVYPEEVEKMLIKHPSIEAAAVIGIPDEKRGESVKAFVVLSNSGTEITEAEIISWAKERMSAYKYPREVSIVSELPKTSTGKLLRRLLKNKQEEQ